MQPHDRRRRARDNRTEPAVLAAVIERPDRVALWAVVMGVIALIAGAASASAGTGGVGQEPRCHDKTFGQRKLKLGDCGTDVMTLNWILKSKQFEQNVSLRKSFKGGTRKTVRRFQRRKGIKRSGVVNRKTGKKLGRSMKPAAATWYDLSGRTTACGVKLKPKTVGVAHRSLPCGTKVTFKKGGRFIRTRVIDRGPYVRGVRWDLTKEASRRLGHDGRETVRAAVIK